MPRILLLILLLIPYTAGAQTRTYIYRNPLREGAPATTTRLDTLASGFRLQVIRHSETEDIVEKLQTDADFAVVRWDYRNPNSDSDFRAERSGSEIILKGVHRGEEVVKTFQIDEHHWHQVFPHDLSSWFLSGSDKHLFWAIGTSGKGEMKCGKFKALRKNRETLALEMGSQSAVRVEISLAGLLSMFWKGNYWLRETDGRYLMFKGKAGPKSEETVTELYRETVTAAETSAVSAQ